MFQQMQMTHNTFTTEDSKCFGNVFVSLSFIKIAWVLSETLRKTKLLIITCSCIAQSFQNIYLNFPLRNNFIQILGVFTGNNPCVVGKGKLGQEGKNLWFHSYHMEISCLFFRAKLLPLTVL